MALDTVPMSGELNGEKKRGRLSTEVAVLLLCASLLPAIVLALVGGYSLTQGLIEIRQDALVEIADETAMDLDNLFQQVRADAQVAANMGGVGIVFDAMQNRPSSSGAVNDARWAVNYLSEEMGALLSSRRSYESLQLFNESGKELVSLGYSEGRVQPAASSAKNSLPDAADQSNDITRRMPLLNVPTCRSAASRRSGRSASDCLKTS